MSEERAVPEQADIVAAAREPHPLLRAGKFVVLDLLSTLVFVGLYAVSHSIYLATGLGIAIGLGEIAYEGLHGAPIATMQWLSLCLVIGFGAATLITNNPVFILLKPTLIYAIVGAVMLKPGWLNRYLPPIAQARGGDIIYVFGFIWASLMFATAAANLAFALHGKTALYIWFLSVFPLASKITLILIQYGVMRFIIRRRIRASDALALA